MERLVDFLPPLCPLLLPDHVLQVEGEPTNVVTRRLIDRGVPSSAAVQEDDALVGDVLEQLREVGTQAVQQDVLVLGVCQVELEALPLLAESLEEVREPVAVPGASRRLLQALQAKSEEAYLLALRHCRLAGSDPCVIYHVRQLGVLSDYPWAACQRRPQLSFAKRSVQPVRHVAEAGNPHQEESCPGVPCQRQLLPRKVL